MQVTAAKRKLVFELGSKHELARNKKDFRQREWGEQRCGSVTECGVSGGLGGEPEMAGGSLDALQGLGDPHPLSR
jgi:hypothetical protein